MSEEKDFMEENTINNDTDDMQASQEAVADDNFDGDADQIEETVESYTEEVQEYVEEVPEEDAEAILDEMVQGAEIPEKASLSKAAVAAISSLITLVVCAVAVFAVFITTYNPYNSNKDGYIETIDDVAAMTGKTLEEIKEEYSFPADMRGDTYSVAAINYMPVGVYFEKMQGMSPDMVGMYAQMMGITEEVDANTPYGKFNKLMTEASMAAQSQEAPEAEEAPAEEQAPAVEEAEAQPEEVTAE